jgi:hypothetical protein
MANNREMLKEAIAEAKAVKEMAIANAKAALEEAFTPQLKSMLSMKLHEMELEEEDDINEYSEEHEDPITGKRVTAADVTEDNMMEIDLEELLAELEMDEPLNEAEEEEEEEEEGGEEGEPLDLEDMTDEDLKKMIEDVIASMISSGELEAGEGGEEEEGEEMEMADEEEVDLAELLKEIDEMEEDVYEAENQGLPSGGQISSAIEKLKAAVKNGEISKEELSAFGDAGKEEVQDDKLEALSEAEGENLKNIIQQDIEKLKKDRRVLKIATILGISVGVAGILSFAFGVSQDVPEAVSASVGQVINMAPAAIAGLGALVGGLTTALGSASKSFRKGQELTSKERELNKMEEDLNEAYSTIKTLKRELNEINLLNAKLLYTNKIFKAKTLNENQKVKVLSSFDRAKNVGEVKMVYETLNEGIKVAKNTIKENLGRASKSTITPTKKQPIVESNDVFKRMQKLAGLI